MNGEGMAVCIVDDDPGVLKYTKLVFENFGYKVLIAESGEEFLKRKHEFSGCTAILVDVMMPGVSGYDVCGDIKSYNKLRKIKVFVYTALPAEEVEKNSRQAGADSYIMKGINPEGMVKIVKGITNNTDAGGA